MTNQHRPSLSLSLFLLLATALTGCGVTNAEARFGSDTARIEVGSTHDLVLTDVTDLSALHVRGANDSVGFSVMTVPGFLFGERQVVRVQGMAQGSATLELLDGDTLLDTIDVTVGTVARFEVVADAELYGADFVEDYGVLVGQDVLLRLEARDALDRPFDGYAPRSMGVEGGFDVVFGWDALYAFRASAAGTHTITLEGDTGADLSVDVTAVEPSAVRALRIAPSVRNEGTCLAASGETDDALPVLGIEPAFMVDGETIDSAAALGVLCFDEEPARGTEVTAIWHELSVTYTF